MLRVESIKNNQKVKNKHVMVHGHQINNNSDMKSFPMPQQQYKILEWSNL